MITARPRKEGPSEHAIAPAATATLWVAAAIENVPTSAFAAFSDVAWACSPPRGTQP